MRDCSFSFWWWKVNCDVQNWEHSQSHIDNQHERFSLCVRERCSDHRWNERAEMSVLLLFPPSISLSASIPYWVLLWTTLVKEWLFFLHFTFISLKLNKPLGKSNTDSVCPLTLHLYFGGSLVSTLKCRHNFDCRHVLSTVWKCRLLKVFQIPSRKMSFSNVRCSGVLAAMCWSKGKWEQFCGCVLCDPPSLIE